METSSTSYRPAKSFGLSEEWNLVIKGEMVSKSPNYPLTRWTRNPWVISIPFRGETNKLKPNNNLKKKNKANGLELEQESNVGAFFQLFPLQWAEQKSLLKALKGKQGRKLNHYQSNSERAKQGHQVKWQVCLSSGSEPVHRNETSIARNKLMHH